MAEESEYVSGRIIVNENRARFIARERIEIECDGSTYFLKRGLPLNIDYLAEKSRTFKEFQGRYNEQIPAKMALAQYESLAQKFIRNKISNGKTAGIEKIIEADETTTIDFEVEPSVESLDEEISALLKKKDPK